MANPFLAQALLPAQRARAGFQLGSLVTREEEEERRQAFARQRTLERQSGRGRLLGGVGGGVLARTLGKAALTALTGGTVNPLVLALITGAGTGLGSAFGQKKATRGARRRIDPGTFFTERGRTRERDFGRFTEQSRMANAIMDAFSGTQASQLDLGRIFGQQPGQTFMAGPEDALLNLLMGADQPSSLERSLLGALR